MVVMKKHTEFGISLNSIPSFVTFSVNVVCNTEFREKSHSKSIRISESLA